jgi:hypothetical protein
VLRLGRHLPRLSGQIGLTRVQCQLTILVMNLDRATTPRPACRGSCRPSASMPISILNRHQRRRGAPRCRWEAMCLLTCRHRMVQGKKSSVSERYKRVPMHGWTRWPT